MATRTDPPARMSPRLACGADGPSEAPGGTLWHGASALGGRTSMNMTDYEETRRTFRLDVPDGFHFPRDVVDGWAAREPSKVALVAVDPDGRNRRELTFAQIARSANRVANALQGMGV